jgi:hypothetical protein
VEEPQLDERINILPAGQVSYCFPPTQWKTINKSSLCAACRNKVKIPLSGPCEIFTPLVLLNLVVAFNRDQTGVLILFYRGTIVKRKVYPVKQFLQFTFNRGSFHRGDSSEPGSPALLDRQGGEKKGIPYARKHLSKTCKTSG